MRTPGSPPTHSQRTGGSHTDMRKVLRPSRLFREIVMRLEELEIRREDVLILISENAWEDWFAGRL